MTKKQIRYYIKKFSDYKNIEFCWKSEVLKGSTKLFSGALKEAQTYIKHNGGRGYDFKFKTRFKFKNKQPHHVIVLDRDQLKSEREILSCLLHELGHCNGIGFNKLANEYYAHMWAINVAIKYNMNLVKSDLIYEILSWRGYKKAKYYSAYKQFIKKDLTSLK